MAQIQKGDTFADGQQVTGARLNQLVDSAVLNVEAISAQAAQTAQSVLAGNELIINDSGSLKKTTAGDILMSSLPIKTGSITGKTGVDLTITPAAGKKVIVAGEMDVGKVNATGLQTIIGNIEQTGNNKTTGNLEVTGTTKAFLTADSTVVTPSAGDNSTKPASTAFVTAAVSAASPIKAFAKVSGTTINAQLNIASVSNPSAGVYIFTFTNPMADANYVISASVLQTSTSNGYFCYVSTMSGSSFTVTTGYAVSYGGAFVLSNVTSLMVSVMK